MNQYITALKQFLEGKFSWSPVASMTIFRIYITLFDIKLRFGLKTLRNICFVFRKSISLQKRILKKDFHVY